MFLVGSKVSAIEGPLHVPSIVFRFIFMAVNSHVLRAFVDLVHICPSERENTRKCILNYSSFACLSVSPLLWLHHKMCLSQQNMFKVNGVAFHLVFCGHVISSLSIDKNYTEDGNYTYEPARRFGIFLQRLHEACNADSC